MYTLFIDTHDAQISIVLYKEDKVIDKNIKVSSRNHSDFTMPMIKELLVRNNMNVHDLKQIFICNGPGSFTGVRLGVTIAKTLAYTLNIPIKTITSLDCYAISSKSDKKLPIIRDVKGVFANLYDKDNHPLSGAFYKSNEEFKEYVKNNNLENSIIENIEYDYDAIYKYLNNVEPTNPHQVNPLYIKIIEALKND